MIGVFGAGMAVHFSPKDLGLSAGALRTVFGQSELGFLGQFQDDLSDH